jgi:hypothetical protein
MIKLLVMTSGKRRTRVAWIAFPERLESAPASTRDPGETGRGEGFSAGGGSSFRIEA